MVRLELSGIFLSRFSQGPSTLGSQSRPGKRRKEENSRKQTCVKEESAEGGDGSRREWERGVEIDVGEWKRERLCDRWLDLLLSR